MNSFVLYLFNVYFWYHNRYILCVSILFYLIYALCATIYYYLSGDNPVEVIERISGKKLKNLSEYNTSVFPELENVILKGMSVDIKDRYQSMEEFCEALYGAANESLGF